MDQEREYRIRLRAYELWSEAGGPPGRHLDFWVLAEREDQVRSLDQDLEEGLDETFPASDVPASLRRESKEH